MTTLPPGARRTYISPRALFPRVSAGLALGLLGLLSTVAQADGPYSYSWVVSPWVTTAGTATCTESAPQTRSVACQRDDGQAADASLCDPAQQRPDLQYVTDYTSCTYRWTVSDWSPAAGAACTTSLAQSRIATCLRSDGTATDSSYCTDTAPAVSQSIVDLGTCTYAWKGNGFSDCQDSTDTNHPSWLYIYSGWAPALGCGATSQYRTATCSSVPNSGSQSQTVGCVRSDGRVADPALCLASERPATSQACTPQTPHCDVNTLGSLGPSTVTLTNGCAGTGQTVSGGTWQPAPAVPTPPSQSSYEPTPVCVPDPLKHISCLRCVPDASKNVYCIKFNLANVTS